MSSCMVISLYMLSGGSMVRSLAVCRFITCYSKTSIIYSFKNYNIMSTKKSNKTRIYLSVIITIIGCVLACSSIIPNDYLKLLVVMCALGYGLFGIMKGLSNSGSTEEPVIEEKD